MTIPNAIYRCAGLRQGFDLQNNLNADAGLATFNPPFNWTAQVAADPTLGYVYTTSGPGLRRCTRSPATLCRMS